MSAIPWVRWPVRAGNSVPKAFRELTSAGAGQDLTGSVLVLTITLPSGLLTLRSNVDGQPLLWNQADPNEIGFYSVQFTIQQTRDFLNSTPLFYEIEQWLEGQQRTLVEGEIVVTEGNNIDA